jgi:tRNA pseudouridine55 synthase
MATGVLVLGLEKATKLLGHLTLTDKSYDATIRLGVATVTDDADGEVVATVSAAGVTLEQVHAGLLPLTGAILQAPSAVSAIKVDGRRSYARVRAGEEVTLPARPVTVSELVAGEVCRPSPDLLDVDVRVTCSSGTYVRALARDLGAALGVGGHLTSLRRTRVGPFGLDRASTLDELAVDLSLVPLDRAVRDAFPAVEVAADEAAGVGFGRGVARPTGLADRGPVGVFAADGTVLALMEPSGDVLRPLVVFVAR